MRHVDPEHGGRRPRPQHVRDRPVAHQLGAVEHVGVGAELLGRVVDAGPALVLSSPSIVVLPCSSCSEPSSWIIADDGVGRRAAEHARVHRAAQRLERDVDARHAAQRGRERRDADREVARVDDEDRVGAQQLDVLGHERLQPAGALLLRALADQLDAAREAAVDLLERAQRGEVHDDVALAVGASRGRTSGRRARSARTPAPSTRPRRAAAGRRSGSRAARSACPRARARGRARSCEPSGVSDMRTSCRPAAANASTTHCAAFSHSSGGNCFGSATDRNETSSARSSFAWPIRPLTA